MSTYLYFRTPTLKCAVKTCPNYFGSFEKRHLYPYKFHHFPKDNNVAIIWKKNCGLSKNAPVGNLMVCSAHFYLDDYQRNYKEEFSNPDFKRPLKSTAVPSQNIMAEHAGPEEGNSEEAPVADHSYHIEKEVFSFYEIKKAVDLHAALGKQIEELQEKNLHMKQKSLKMRKNLQCFRTKLRQFQTNTVETDELQKVFSPSQINLLLGRKKVYWSDDDLGRAFTLRHIGGRDCYLYLKNTLCMPLPALSCVQRWASSGR